MRSSKRLISGVLSTILCLGGVSAGNNRSLATGEKALVAAGVTATIISVGAFKFSDKIRDFFRSPARRRTSKMERASNYVEQNVNLNDKMDQMPEKNVGPTKWFSCECQKEPEFSSVEALFEKNGGVKLTFRDWLCLSQSKVGIYPLGKNGNVCKCAICIRNRNIKNGESLTKNVKRETVNRILGIEDISVAESPVSYSEKLGYYVEVDFRLDDDAKNLAEIIEPLVAIALQLNLKDDKESVSGIARYLAYKDNGEYYANDLVDALFHGRYRLDNDGEIDYTW